MFNIGIISSLGIWIEFIFKSIWEKVSIQGVSVFMFLGYLMLLHSPSLEHSSAPFPSLFLQLLALSGSKPQLLKGRNYPQIISIPWGESESFFYRLSYHSIIIHNLSSEFLAYVFKEFFHSRQQTHVFYYPWESR